MGIRKAGHPRGNEKPVFSHRRFAQDRLCLYGFGRRDIRAELRKRTPPRFQVVPHCLTVPRGKLNLKEGSAGEISALPVILQ